MSNANKGIIIDHQITGYQGAEMLAVKNTPITLVASQVSNTPESGVHSAPTSGTDGLNGALKITRKEAESLHQVVSALFEFICACIANGVTTKHEADGSVNIGKVMPINKIIASVVGGERGRQIGSELLISGQVSGKNSANILANVEVSITCPSGAIDPKTLRALQTILLHENRKYVAKLPTLLASRKMLLAQMISPQELEFREERRRFFLEAAEKKFMLQI